MDLLIASYIILISFLLITRFVLQCINRLSLHFIDTHNCKTSNQKIHTVFVAVVLTDNFDSRTALLFCSDNNRFSFSSNSTIMSLVDLYFS